MPVQYLAGKGYPNPAALMPIPKALRARARVNALSALFAIDGTMSAGTILLIGRAPSAAILLRASALVVSAGISAGAANVGLDRGGGWDGVTYVPSAEAQPTALLAAQSLTAAAAVPLLGGFTNAKLDQPLWQVMGLATDPGDLVTLYASLSSGGGGAGSVFFDVLFKTED